MFPLPPPSLSDAARKVPMAEIMQGPLPGENNKAGDLIAQGKTLVETRTGYQTAVQVQYPRDLKDVQRRCLEEAAIAGEACFYGWGSGKDRVEGPSIELAMILARNWGNCAVVTRDPLETPTAYILSTDIIDLQTGFTYCRPFRQSKKWTVHGKMDEVRKDDVRFQIGVSKSQRNSILRMIPGWLVDKAMERAKEGVRESIEKFIANKGVEGARKRALDGLGKFGVKLENIEHKYGAKYQAWDVEILVLLAGDISALSKGIEAADVLFPDPASAETVDPETGEIKGKIDPQNIKPGDPKDHQGYGKPNTEKKEEF